MATFKLIFTNMHASSGKVIITHETTNHGWKCKEDFLKSILRKNVLCLIPNGYSYLRCENTVVSMVEAIST